jgi:hypothetical protein
MRTTRWTIAVLLALVFAMGAALTAIAQSKKQLKQAQKLLSQLKLVDGGGSGLDADTVQGMTPTQLKASITPPPPQQTLDAVKQVDGAGSGLDADTLRGLAPAQVAALAPPGAGGGLVVRDVNGTLVGIVSGLAFPGVDVIRRENNTVFVFNVTENGFTDGGPGFLYTSTDCSGTAYLDGTQTLIHRAQVKNAIGYYAGDPIGVRTIQSSAEFADPSACMADGLSPKPGGLCCCDDRLRCVGPSGQQLSVGPSSTIDLGPLGLVPPFHVEGP